MCCCSYRGVVLKLLSVVVTIFVGLFASNFALASVNFNYLVLGVIASSKTNHGVALLKDTKSGKVKAIREGKSLTKKIHIHEVGQKFVTFNVEGEKLIMGVGDSVLSKAEPTKDYSSSLVGMVGIEKKENTLKISETMKRDLIGNNLSKILMQAATLPYVKKGRLLGFQLLDIEEGSIYDVAGFQDGDVVTHIGEFALNDAGTAIRVLNSMRDFQEVNLTFLRKGEEQAMSIQVH